MSVLFTKKNVKAKQQYERTKNPELVKEISRCHNIQWARKIALNSPLYIGNQYFRYYDVRRSDALQLLQFIIRP